MPDRKPEKHAATRIFFWLLGAIFFVLGIIGAFLPVMPTVPFIIAASACWAKASPRLHAYLRNHPQFGAQLRNWEDHGTIPRKAKWLASIAMTCSCSGTLVFFWLTDKPIWIPLLVTGTCLCVGVWIWLRPEPGQRTQKTPKTPKTQKHPHPSNNPNNNPEKNRYTPPLSPTGEGQGVRGTAERQKDTTTRKTPEL